ncbi:SMP-30/gluconolactonase/LRE family protein [Pseudoduganella chitinolytica]|uniref:SMP-30/gluconolactonase/LRE family protein n=1 Tax=Pseudoduganella chitinolytica TaxID=34070 RepID=A0ABY8B880_9BURK|nr:SMP-30/gluconolactonase/LRE family protein [Pseudoduganella chitinolytica]WEF31916.1 SMP-30/gluconolactonase/LRE family protein [Pseudoduganella chitinolytica]
MPQALHEGEALHLALPHRAALGDGLVWQPGAARWWWTDVPAATLYAWADGAPAAYACRLPDRAGSLAFCRSGRMLVGLAKWLCYAEAPAGPLPARLPLRPIVAVDPAEPRTRVGDGRTDRAGNFVFGTRMDGAEPRAIGSFYQFSHRHGLRRLALPATALAGSICFSPDGGTMYFGDAQGRGMLQCDYDPAEAQVTGVRPFAQLRDDVARPHGAVVDSDGCLWNAEWGGGRLTRYAPDGTMLRSHRLPVAHPTRPAFGGPALEHLLVSSAGPRVGGKAAAADAGSLFQLATPGVHGLADTLFNDD